MPAPAHGASARAWTIDALKSVAALFIVWHHSLLYGPLAQAAEHQAPALAGWLQHYGRFAVQVFLVAGGFLALRGLLRSAESAPALLLRRHQRLALPFVAALLLTLLAHALTADSLPDLLPQDLEPSNLLAHGLLLHGVLGQESLTVGAWYVAIDFQLYALLLGLVLLARRGWPLTLLLAAGVLASAWGFNRFSGGDNWAPYFFAAYGLGALAALPGPRHRHGLWMLSLLCALALLLDFRGRLLLALLSALALNRFAESGPPPGLQRLQAVLAWLSARSYALFLLHFAVLLLGNCAFLLMGGPPWLWVMACSLAAVAAAHVFHQKVERSLAGWDPVAALQRLRGQPQRAWPLLPVVASGWGLELMLS